MAARAVRTPAAEGARAGTTGRVAPRPEGTGGVAQAHPVPAVPEAAAPIDGVGPPTGTRAPARPAVARQVERGHRVVARTADRRSARRATGAVGPKPVAVAPGTGVTAVPVPSGPRATSGIGRLLPTVSATPVATPRRPPADPRGSTRPVVPGRGVPRATGRTVGRGRGVLRATGRTVGRGRGVPRATGRTVVPRVSARRALGRTGAAGSAGRPVTGGRRERPRRGAGSGR